MSCTAIAALTFGAGYLLGRWERGRWRQHDVRVNDAWLASDPRFLRVLGQAIKDSYSRRGW